MPELKLLAVLPKKVAKKVEVFSDIQEVALEMLALVYHPRGERVAVALHHAQVSPEPKSFFVVRENVFPDNDQVIINPVIKHKFPESKERRIEGCMSFPFRPDIKVPRYMKLIAEYWVPSDGVEKDDPLTLVRKERTLEGLAAQVMQHEILHGFGQNIYQN